MDYGIVQVLKSKNGVDLIFSSNFGKKFDDWLDERREPYFRIYELFVGFIFNNCYIPPYAIDFKSDLISSLHKKTGMKDKGKPTYVEYFSEKMIVDTSGTTVYQNKVARIDFELTYDVTGFILQKKALLRWYKSDDTLSEEFKDIGKVFDPVRDHEARIQEGITRREAIVDGLQLPVMGMLLRIFYGQKSQAEVIALGRQYLLKHEEGFRLFIKASIGVSDPTSPDYGKKLVAIDIENDDEFWLDTVTDIGTGPITPRAFMLYSLSNI
jgi:hypothetical protein